MSSRGFAEDPPARQRDVETLRRLTRDAFAEITSTRDRLADLERSVGTDRAARLGDRARVESRVTLASALPFSVGGDITHENGRRHAPRNCGSLIKATTTVETPFANGDGLVMRLSATQAPGEPSQNRNRQNQIASPRFVLEKLAYRVRLRHDAWVRLVMLGGEGHDAGATLNPTSKGATLIGAGARGAAALKKCRGPAFCFSKDSANGAAGIAGGVFLGDPSVAGSENGRALLQLTCRPGSRAAASIAVSVPARGARAADETDRFETDEVSQNASQNATRTLSAQGLFALGNDTLIGAWVSSGACDWGICATIPPSPGAIGWGVGFGRGDGDGDCAGVKRGSQKPPLRGEVFLRLGNDEEKNRKTAMPGIVVARNDATKRWDVSLACKVQFDVAG